ncbi:hypothetical protein [Vibrio cholerae]|uniref:hypothetical protein n=1 Tax=Vibrio cholerae TaxID=666 RepID=UPI000E0A5B73|nr:hypothetical protein [Vibrio cholerae]
MKNNKENKMIEIKNKRFIDLDEALSTIQGEVIELSKEKMEQGYVRHSVDPTLEQLKADFKTKLAEYHKLNIKYVSDPMLLEHFNLWVNTDVTQPSTYWFNREYRFKVIQDQAAKLDQLDAIKWKIELFRGMQGEEHNYHDYNTQFDEDVCLITLHSLVRSNWLKHVEPIMQMETHLSTNQKFTNWLSSSVSDHFVITCWIALSNAQKSLETVKDVELNPLHWTTTDIKRDAAFFELELLQEEINFHTRSIEDMQVKLKDKGFSTTSNKSTKYQIKLHKMRLKELQLRQPHLEELSKEQDYENV